MYEKSPMSFKFGNNYTSPPEKSKGNQFYRHVPSCSTDFPLCYFLTLFVNSSNVLMLE